MDQPQDFSKEKAPASEPNAQNSELAPEAHPSGARIEKLMTPETDEPPAKESYGQIFRPSERDDIPRADAPKTDDNHVREIPMIDEPAEGGRDIVDHEFGHRQSPETRDEV